MKLGKVFVLSTVASLLVFAPARAEEAAIEKNVLELSSLRSSKSWEAEDRAIVLIPSSPIATSGDSHLLLIVREPEELVENEPEPPVENSNRWSFEFQPTLLIPFQLEGEVDFEGDFGFDGLEGIRIGDTDLLERNPPELLNLLPPGTEIGEGSLLGDLLPSGTIIRSLEYEFDTDDLSGLDSLLRLSGRFRAKKGPLALILDAQYTRVENSGEVTIESVAFDLGSQTVELDLGIDIENEFRFQQGYLDLAASYRIFETGKSSDQQNYPILFFEPLAGIRMGFLDIDLDLAPGPDIDVNEFFLEPLVGGVLGLQVSQSIVLGVRGDVSGFGAGINPEELNWNLVAGLQWRASRRFELRVAYRIQDIEIDGDVETSGSVLSDSTINLDQREQGVWLGFTFFFGDSARKDTSGEIEQVSNE